MSLRFFYFSFKCTTYDQCMQKDFETWNKKKQEINSRDVTILFHEREVRWCSLGVNIGYEQDGKHEQFERPVLILRKFNRDTALVAPITSRIKNNKYYLVIKREGKLYSVIISQIRLISSKRFLRYMYTLDKGTFDTIISHIKDML